MAQVAVRVADFKQAVRAGDRAVTERAAAGNLLRIQPDARLEPLPVVVGQRNQRDEIGAMGAAQTWLATWTISSYTGSASVSTMR